MTSIIKRISDKQAVSSTEPLAPPTEYDPQFRRSTILDFLENIKFAERFTPFAVRLQKINIHLCPNFFLYGQ